MKQGQTWLTCILLSVCAPASPSGDDSLLESARLAAITRLQEARATATLGASVCGDAAVGSRKWGTSCASREFSAPPLLEAPKLRWQVDYGWWGTWSPWIGEGLLLTGSCANETNQGLSALDLQTGKMRWKLASICQEANRNGSMGSAAFHEAGPGKVFFALRREDRPGIDWMLIELKTGRVLEQYKPVKNGGTTEVGGAFSVFTTSKEKQRSYLNLLSPKLDRIVGRYEEFRFGCPLSENQCPPTNFSLPAASDGLLFLSGMSVDQAEPPTRQLHAFEVATGALRWRHTDQPTRKVDGSGRKVRSDDERPMIVDGKVIIRLEDENSHMLRAFDPTSGRILWTTDKQPRRVMNKRGLLQPHKLSTWIGAGKLIVGHVTSDDKCELLGWSTSDGKQRWSREVPRDLNLTASAGGVFYTAYTIDKPGNMNDELEISGYEAATGTKLWSTIIPAHNRPFTGEWSITTIDFGAAGGPGWRIGPDGAIYGVTLKGAYKLQ